MKTCKWCDSPLEEPLSDLFATLGVHPSCWPEQLAAEPLDCMAQLAKYARRLVQEAVLHVPAESPIYYNLHEFLSAYASELVSFELTPAVTPSPAADIVVGSLVRIIGASTSGRRDAIGETVRVISLNPTTNIAWVSERHYGDGSYTLNSLQVVPEGQPPVAPPPLPAQDDFRQGDRVEIIGESLYGRTESIGRTLPVLGMGSTAVDRSYVLVSEDGGVFHYPPRSLRLVSRASP